MDEPELSTEQAPPAVRPEASYKVVELEVGSEGAFSGKVRLTLSAKIYTRVVAVRLAQHEAKVSERQGLYVLVDPSGRSIAVFSAGTGRPAPTLVAMRAKRAVRELMPRAAPRKRTSRPPVTATRKRAPVVKKRTSRGR